MRKILSWTILMLSLLLVFAGIAGVALSATGPKGKAKEKKEEKAPPPKAAPAPEQKKVFVITIDAPITPV